MRVAELLLLFFFFSLSLEAVISLPAGFRALRTRVDTPMCTLICARESREYRYVCPRGIVRSNDRRVRDIYYWIVAGHCRTPVDSVIIPGREAVQIGAISILGTSFVPSFHVRTCIGAEIADIRE